MKEDQSKQENAVGVRFRKSVASTSRWNITASFRHFNVDSSSIKCFV
jgi:hypothetical protein